MTRWQQAEQRLLEHVVECQKRWPTVGCRHPDSRWGGRLCCEGVTMVTAMLATWTDPDAHREEDPRG